MSLVISYPSSTAFPICGVQAQYAPPWEPLPKGSHSRAAVTKPDCHLDNLKTRGKKTWWNIKSTNNFLYIFFLIMSVLDCSQASILVLQVSWKMRSSKVLVIRPVFLTEVSTLLRAQSNCCACLDCMATLVSLFFTVARA